MIKSLKVAAFLLGLSSLAVVVLVVILALRTDDKTQEFFSLEGEIAKFVASASAAKSDESPDSPLIKQAEAFALRIDPPPPPQPVITNPAGPSLPRPQERIAPPPSASFKVAGTVVSPDPQYSMVLLDTTAKGLRWYRLNEKIGHSTIEQILEDRVVLNDGTKSYDMEVPKKQKISLIKGSPDNPYTDKKVNPYKLLNNQPTNFVPDLTPEIQPAASKTPQPAKEEFKPTAEAMKENLDFLQKIVNDPESMGMSKEEAAQLGDMSELLGEMEKEMADLQKQEAKEKQQKQAPPPATETPRSRRSRRSR